MMTQALPEPDPHSAALSSDQRNYPCGDPGGALVRQHDVTEMTAFLVLMVAGFPVPVPIIMLQHQAAGRTAVDHDLDEKPIPAGTEKTTPDERT